MMQTPTDNSPYYVVVRFGDRESLNPGQLKIWKSYDPDHIWGSPAYDVADRRGPGYRTRTEAYYAALARLKFGPSS